MKLTTKDTENVRLAMERNQLAMDRNILAKERTDLAKERTHLSYIRTGITILMGGIFFIGYFREQHQTLYSYFGYAGAILGLLFIIYGIYAHIKAKKLVKTISNELDNLNHE